MKKLRLALTIILCFVTAFTCALTANAESISYELGELGMTISLPDSMTVKTAENSQELEDGIYLEAVNSDSSLIISVSMMRNAETERVYTFVDQPNSVLNEFKESMEAEGFSEGKYGTYGGVPFLDFSQKSTSEAGVDVYTRHSITLINGMSISVVSQSPSDNFTSEELNILKACLDSIEFESAVDEAEKSGGFLTVFLWIVIILVVLVLGFLALSYYMGKRNAEKKRAIAQEKQRKADYDVLSRADMKAKKQATSQVGGYKTSSDYFDSDFDTQASPQKAVSSLTDAQSQSLSGAEKAVKETKSAFTHMGYFFRNLKKEFSSGKGKKNGKKRASAKSKPKAKDYDIFSDR